LSQSTHSSVAYSTSSRCLQGPRFLEPGTPSSSVMCSNDRAITPLPSRPSPTGRECRQTTQVRVPPPTGLFISANGHFLAPQTPAWLQSRTTRVVGTLSTMSVAICPTPRPTGSCVTKPRRRVGPSAWPRGRAEPAHAFRLCAGLHCEHDDHSEHDEQRRNRHGCGRPVSRPWFFRRRGPSRASTERSEPQVVDQHDAVAGSVVSHLADCLVDLRHRHQLDPGQHAVLLGERKHLSHQPPAA
jgi:hypothetical protein